MAHVEPSEAQKEAGNYAKDHVRVHGLDISIENRKDSQRSGIDPDGQPWSVKMPASYGYIKGTVGHDGDHVDCYLGPHVKAPNVFVINQVDADTGKFDEHKCMIGFASKKQAIDTYRKGFSDGRAGERIGSVSDLPIEVFKQTLENYAGRKERAAGGRVQEFAEGGPPSFDPDAYLKAAPAFDPDAYLKADKPKAMPWYEKAVEPITSYPETYMKMQGDALREVDRGIGQLRNPDGAWDVAKGAGNVALGSLGYATSPINAGLRTVVGKPIEDATRGYLPKEYTEFAAGLAIPGIGLTRMPHGAVPKVPTPPSTPPSIAGVTLTEGEATRALPLIQREQGALRGEKALGERSHEHAQAFARQREAEIAASHENVARALDPFGQIIAETPHEAGRLASRAIQEAADASKTGVTSAYDYAKSLPGEIHAGSFEGIAPQIKNALSMRENPVIISEKLTPFADEALKYVDGVIGKIRIPNHASLSRDTVMPEIMAGENAHISLRGLDQWRKNLVAYRKGAASSGNASDASAARAVLDAYDDTVERLVQSPAFRGDPRAAQAWMDARAAHAEHMGTFGKQGGRDPVGNVVQKVLGDRMKGGVMDPAIPSDVANFAFGASGVVQNSLNAGVGRRFREILGATSPEWSGVQQGLWARLTETTTGEAFGHKKIADRITAFLANPEVANVYYEPWKQSLMREYADMHRRITVPQAGAQWSNNVTTKTFENISNKVGTVIGAIMGGSVGKAMGIPLVGEVVGAAAAQIPKRFDQAKEARRIEQQMPILAGRMQAYARAMSRVQATAAPTPMSERIVRTTAIQLDHTLRKFGISLDQAAPLGPIPGRAEENRPQ